MSEYKMQIAIASIVGVVIIVSLGIGIYLSPLSNNQTYVQTSTSTQSSTSSYNLPTPQLKVYPNFTIPVGQQPNSVLYYPDDNVILMVASYFAPPKLAASLLVINVTTNQVIESVLLGPTTTNTHSMAYDPANHEVYVSISSPEPGTCCTTSILAMNSGYSIVSTINLSKSIASEALMEYNNVNKEMYVSMLGGINYILALNQTNQVVANITVNDVAGLAYNPNSGAMYVSGLNSGVYVIGSNNSILDLVNIGGPVEMTFDPANGYIYVISHTGNGVIALNGTSIAGSVTLGNGDWSYSFNPQNGNLYVSNIGPGTVTVINKTNQVVTTLKMAAQGGIYDPKHDWMLFSTGQNITLVDSENKIVGFGIVPGSALEDVLTSTTMFYLPDNGCAYVLSPLNSTASVFC